MGGVHKGGPSTRGGCPQRGAVHKGDPSTGDGRAGELSVTKAPHKTSGAGHCMCIVQKGSNFFLYGNYRPVLSGVVKRGGFCLITEGIFYLNAGCVPNESVWYVEIICSH